MSRISVFRGVANSSLMAAGDNSLVGDAEVENGLSGAEIAGATLGSVLGFALLAVGVALFVVWQLFMTRRAQHVWVSLQC